MKKQKIIMAITTGIFGLSMLFSAYMYLTDAEVKAGFSSHLGIPDYLRVELAVAKILGSLALMLPFVPKGFKYFAYAGFTINLISASVAHIAVGDPASQVVMPFVYLVILAVSFIYYRKLEKGKQNIVA
ncbi:hypothetical protein FIC_01077 [Flavobacteriaceae bacterium 3519-10]|nr:hypothetical protein FIC_01077 [Flavobacteriaceae bacterium 3519-10]